jgi:uncharacterized membrane protein YccC
MTVKGGIPPPSAAPAGDGEPARTRGLAPLLLVLDRFVAADPGLTRLLLATRVTLAVALSVGALACAATVFPIPITVTILGALVSMQGVLAVNDDQPEATTALAAIPGMIGIALGAVFAERGFLADVVFLLILFAAVAVRARGPRWTAFGTLAMITYFFALFFGATVDELPELLGAVVATIAITYVVRFILVPDRPAWLARRTLAAFEARIRTVAGAALALLETRDPGPARRRLIAATQRLNETAASIESRLGDGASAEIRTIFDAELAAEDLAAAAMALRDVAGTVPRALRLALMALARGRVARAARIAARATADVRSGNARPAVGSLAAAITDLGSTVGQVDAAAELLALTTRPWAGGSGAQQPALRQAIQVTAASAVAIAIGEAISPQRWYWAVLTTYFVFIGTASAGETFSRAWSRIGGTALGVAAGVLVGHVARGHRTLDIAAIFASLFAGVYVLRISYFMMIFFITALLALLYTLLGRFSDEILAVRLAETAIGAICGGIAATVILPTRTRDVVRASAEAALDATAAVVHASINRLIDPDQAGTPLDSALVLEEAVQHFVARARPWTGVPALIGPGPELRRWIASLNAASYYARLLARTADRSVTASDAATATQLRALDEVIAANVHAAAARIAGQTDARTTSTSMIFETLREGVDEFDADGSPLRTATFLLERLDRTIARLGRAEGTVTEIV